MNVFTKLETNLIKDSITTQLKIYKDNLDRLPQTISKTEYQEFIVKSSSILKKLNNIKFPS